VPSLEEMRGDPAARNEGLSELGSLSDAHLANYLDECKKEAEEATSTERQEWQDYFDLWEGDRDYTDKEKWQSKMVIEKPFSAVEQATAQIQRALLDSPEFLRVEGVPSVLGFPVAFWESYIRGALDKSKFIAHYTDSVQVSFITGIGSYMKPRWNRFQADGTNLSFLSIGNVLPWKIYRDPNSKPREQWSGMYLIHSDMVDLYRLEQSPVYENLDQISGGESDDGRREGRDKKRNPDMYRSRFRKSVLLDEFWGDVLDENGHLVATDVLYAKVGKTIVRRPKPSPIMSWDTNTGRKRWPFIAPIPFTHPHRFEGRGLVQQIVDIILSYENGLNLTSDAMNWKINNPTEFDKSLMDNPTDTKVIPGKGFTRKSPSGSGSAVKPLEFASTIKIPDILAYLEYLDKNYQNNSFINEFVIGLPGYRSDVTKGEVQIKTAQSLAIFDRMGRLIESAGKDMCDLVYDMLVQYTDRTTLPVIGGALDERLTMALASAPPQVRFALMRADLQLKFTGISQALQRSEQLRRLMQISVIAGGPLFQGRLENPSDMLRTMIDLLGYSSTIHVSDQPLIQPPSMLGPNGNIVPIPPPASPGGGPGAAGVSNSQPRGVGAPPKLNAGENVDLPNEQGLFQGSE
jgi:hypothetical protein